MPKDFSHIDLIGSPLFCEGNTLKWPCSLQIFNAIPSSPSSEAAELHPYYLNIMDESHLIFIFKNEFIPKFDCSESYTMCHMSEHFFWMIGELFRPLLRID